MGMWDRIRGQRAGTTRRAGPEDADYLRGWAGARVGVEAYVEPRTSVTETTVVLVAKDGEWTRRRVAGPSGARKLGRELKIPVYDVQLLGYPRRMRDYDARQRGTRRGDEKR
ncbi:hypothetical protein [Pseudonocardia spinosispora]|uniref:hypothetical protein n=1 Tax=Pseudonocardia spinosispora TaxID=103441 RepID=UPI0003FA956D|nr:hypothetical protein [Pseudonocardia spinosispora]